jgi:NADH-quinone oxidoreductase subunit L
MSQIGYMMLAAGLGPAGYAFAIFHLITHGFFKANMFLGAGSVMHGMNDDVEMRHYGGLRTFMPITFATFGLGYLAIIGVPPFAGFWSKDKIIETAFGHSFWVGLGALVGAGVTGFYMTRMMMMTFFSEKRWKEDVHPHESPKVMTYPLIALGALSLLGGAMMLGGWITDFLEPVVGHAEHHELAIPAWLLSVLITLVVAVGVGLSYVLYSREPIAAETPADDSVSFFSRAGRHELYGNELNEAVVVRPTRHLTRFLVFLDGKGVDGFVTGLADRLGEASQFLRKPQTGFVRSYALSIFGGSLVVVLALLAARLA